TTAWYASSISCLVLLSESFFGTTVFSAIIQSPLHQCQTPVDTCEAASGQNRRKEKFYRSEGIGADATRRNGAGPYARHARGRPRRSPYPSDPRASAQSALACVALQVIDSPQRGRICFQRDDEC